MPIAFFGPIGGALADRFPRKLLLIDHDARPDRARRRCSRSCSSSAHPSAPLAHAHRRSATASAPALGFPAFQAMLPDLVPVEDLPGAIALVVGAVQPRARRRARARRRRHRDRRLRVGRRRSTRSASSPSSPCCSRSRSRRRRRTRATRSSSARSLDGFRFVRREPGLRVNVARDVPQHVPRRAVHRARARRWPRRCSTRASAGTSVLVTAQGIGAVAMAFSLGTLVDALRAAGVLLVTLMARAAARARRVRVRARRSRSRRSRSSSSARCTSARSRASRRSRSSARPPTIRGRVLAVNTVILGSLYPLGAVVQGKIADHIGLRGHDVRRRPRC